MKEEHSFISKLLRFLHLSLPPLFASPILCHWSIHCLSFQSLPSSNNYWHYSCSFWFPHYCSQSECSLLFLSFAGKWGLCVKWGLNEDHFSNLVLMITFSTLRASMARAFFLCKILWPFTTVCSSKSHMPPLQWIFPLCAPHLTFSPCVPPSEFSTVLMVYGFLRSPQRKNPLYAPFARKNSSKSHAPAKATNLGCSHSPRS